MLHLPLTTDQATVIDSLQSLPSGEDGTCISCGISSATAEFLVHSAAGHKRIAVVLTDGNSNATAAPPPEPH